MTEESVEIPRDDMGRFFRDFLVALGAARFTGAEARVYGVLVGSSKPLNIRTIARLTCLHRASVRPVLSEMAHDGFAVMEVKQGGAPEITFMMTPKGELEFRRRCYIGAHCPEVQDGSPAKRLLAAIAGDVAGLGDAEAHSPAPRKHAQSSQHQIAHPPEAFSVVVDLGDRRVNHTVRVRTEAEAIERMGRTYRNGKIVAVTPL